MAETLKMAGGKWWRADKYELRNGSIRPAAGARLQEYEPWQEYSVTGATGEDEKAPYETLVALLSDFPTQAGRPVPTAQSQRLLDWCGQYGLLGILPHRAQEVILAPRWESCGDFEDTKWHGRTVFSPTLRRFVKTPFGFQPVVTQAIHPPDDHIVEDSSKCDELVLAEHRPADWPGSRVVLRGLEGRDFVTEPLSTTWAKVKDGF